MKTTFPIVLKELRKNENLTQKQVGDIIGVSQRAYSSYENGDREPSLSTLSDLAKLFQVPVDFLIGGFLWAVDPNYKEVTEHYNISNTKAFAQTLKQMVELARASITGEEPVNVFEKNK